MIIPNIESVNVTNSYSTSGPQLTSGKNKQISLEELEAQLEALKESKKMVTTKDQRALKDIKNGEKFYGTVTTTIKDKDTGKKIRTRITDIFEMVKNGHNGDKITVKDSKGMEYKTSRRGIQLRSYKEDIEEIKKQQELEKKIEEQKKFAQLLKERGVKYADTDTQTKMLRTIAAGIRNLWLCGPAGSGKSVMTRLLAKELNIPYLCISCGIGTSSAEFIGYKYPTREGTKFAEYYSKPSIILLDEFTALDPAVAQICNAALANDEIETTTGTVHRHPDCVIVATSNTYGSGASRQYVANNQLDASTIDRFVGGIIEVNYSNEYESQYDTEVVEYVHKLRNIIHNYDLRRIASTRMIQAGCALKANYVLDWKQQLIINWSENEKRIVLEREDMSWTTAA